MSAWLALPLAVIVVVAVVFSIIVAAAGLHRIFEVIDVRGGAKIMEVFFDFLTLALFVSVFVGACAGVFYWLMGWS